VISTLRRGSIGENSDEEQKAEMSVITESEEEYVSSENHVLKLEQLGRVVLIARDKMDEW
jgi:hypothetical protein